MTIDYITPPDWKPLEDLIGNGCANFMYMGMAEDHIRLYKHIDNRRYINIDDLGHFWKFDGTGYVQIQRDQALQAVEIWEVR